MRYFKDENSYWMQCEGSALTFRYRHKVWGFISDSPDLFRINTRTGKLWKWLGTSVGVNFHTGSNGVWCWFSLYALNGWINVRFQSKEEYHSGY